MAKDKRISRPDDLEVVVDIMRRAVLRTPVNPNLQATMAAYLRETVDSSSIYEIAAVQMIDAKEFRSALLVLTTIAAENETALREWSKIHKRLAELLKDELRERTGELTGLLRSASDRGRKAINARHDKPGGYRDARRKVLESWASGKFKTKTACAMAAQQKFGISHSAALKALRTPRTK
ncbi:MAG: hypothetical protein K0M70_02150 [Arenimonas sp.]|uniref:hypothetical protein n=1 Tax=Arenimonas sp. TaxID=1872635 RepID=UPI0025BFB6B5|nr:hypothetical protein [Arenimonas sp.]MBW8366645.1 hypothetical protein [Arenimonas sp.]